MGTLIVDSYMEISERLKDIISESDNGRVIYTALNYDEALILLKKMQVNTVILDINLPQNKSYELLKQIKKINRHILVIVLSIHTDNHTKEQCMALGADYFFDKYNEFGKITSILN
jgi:DNA-binding NarL/FixJ family response regulator